MEKRSRGRKRKIVKDELSAESAVNTDNCFINILPNEILFYIFSLLTIEDRLRCATVCKRWRNFGPEAWRDVKKLDLIIHEDIETQHPRLLKLCGEVLKDLTLPVPKDSKIIRIATANCSNLIKFRARFVLGRDDRTQHCKDLGRLFIKNKDQLRNVVIDHATRDFVQHTDCLLNLPEELVELQLWGFGAGKELYTCLVHSTQFVPVIKRLKNLEILVLKGFRIENEDVELIKTCEKLRYLNIDGRNPNLLGLTSGCRKLEFLSLYGNHATNVSWVNDFVKNNPGLKHLKLARSDISVEMNRKLLELSALEILDLKNCYFDAGSFDLSGFRNLKKLIANNISESDIIILLETASRLEFVDLFGDLSYPKILREAHTVINRRLNNIPLHIVVAKKFIQKWHKPEEVSPLLIVESSENYRKRNKTEYNGYQVELSN